MHNIDEDPPVAIGELYHQNHVTKYFSLRKFFLSNIYLLYFNRDGEKKGQLDITDCVVNKATADEAGMPAAVYSFSLSGPKKYILVCASNERNREMWIKLINEQIKEFKDEIRRFLRSGEVVYGKGSVRRRGSIVGMMSSNSYKLVLTNFPRILLIDTTALTLKDHYVWTSQNHPIFTKITDTKFKITSTLIPSSIPISNKSDKNNSSNTIREWVFEDVDNGSKYWEDVFKKFPHMEYYNHKNNHRDSIIIDYQDSNKTDTATNRAMHALLRSTNDSSERKEARGEDNAASSSSSGASSSSSGYQDSSHKVSIHTFTYHALCYYVYYTIMRIILFNILC